MEFGVADVKAELLYAFAKCVSAAVLTEHQVGAREPHILRPHDLVGRVMLEHAVLMNAGFVRERVFTDDGFVARNRHTGDLRHQATGWKKACRKNPGMHAEHILASLDRHDGFLERAIAGTFADAVDR